MKHLLTIIVIAIVTISFSCNKSTNDNPIIGRWSESPSTTLGYTNGVLTTSRTDNYDASSYMLFRTNGTFEDLSNGRPEAGTYAILNDSIAFNNVNSGKINILTANDLSYTFKSVLSPTYYTIITFNFHK